MPKVYVPKTKQYENIPFIACLDCKNLKDTKCTKWPDHQPDKPELKVSWCKYFEGK